jgi:peptidoglycan/xylan/chitin deacetylase (PgdA/CDA1 family)
VPARLAKPGGQPFAAFTLDDGYRNNAEHALPVFEKYGVPFTVFVARGFAERTHSMWWETMADLIGRVEELSFDFGTGPERIALVSEEQKFAAFDRFADHVFRGDEESAVSQIDALLRSHGIDPLQTTADLTMDPAQLRDLSRHKLATLGAHTISHRAVGRLSEAQALTEMAGSADYVEELTGIRPTTIAYPYGTRQAVGERDYRIARDLGFSVAVTTQPGTICEAWLTRLTGLPRISLNGHYQRARYVSALASGIPFKLAR